MKAIPLMLLSLMLVLVSGLTQAALPFADSQGDPLPSLAPLIDRISPAVVNIVTFGDQSSSKSRRSRAAGSGVIVDAKQGLVLSNHHVIAKADKIHISLVDGRSFKASLVGSDPGADLALLMIKADKLEALPLADSDQLRVGDFVVAIGNPFGLGQTVTSGIVSALGRTGLGIGSYENFIQTDASINPGNSGGALINLKGELVGINTAIIAPRGGNTGIGFAIPSNMAKAISLHLAKEGEAHRGSLGVSVQDLGAGLAKAFGLPEGEGGVLVSHVKRESAADRAGIKAGDIIVSINDKPIQHVTELRSRLGVLTLKETLRLRVFRDGQWLDLVALLDQPVVVEVDAEAFHSLLAGVAFEGGDNGGAIRVLRVKADSPAAQAGLNPGDLIVAANRVRVNSLEALGNAAAGHDDTLLLRVNRRTGPHYLVLNR